MKIKKLKTPDSQISLVLIMVIAKSIKIQMKTHLTNSLNEHEILKNYKDFRV